MGHVSTWTVLYAYTDLKKPSETTVALMVKTGMKGFSFGTHENKMGQRVCPASVLIFEDCFIPDELVLFDTEMVKQITNKPIRDITQHYIDYVVSATRPGVCAFGVGAARGAFETALKYASNTRGERQAPHQQRVGAVQAGRDVQERLPWAGSPTWRPTMPTATAASTSSSR